LHSLLSLALDGGEWPASHTLAVSLPKEGASQHPLNRSLGELQGQYE